LITVPGAPASSEACPYNDLAMHFLAQKNRLLFQTVTSYNISYDCCTWVDAWLAQTPLMIVCLY